MRKTTHVLRGFGEEGIGAMALERDLDSDTQSWQNRGRTLRK